jgi:hypothetical protein
MIEVEAISRPFGVADASERPIQAIAEPVATSAATTIQSARVSQREQMNAALAVTIAAMANPVR